MPLTAGMTIPAPGSPLAAAYAEYSVGDDATAQPPGSPSAAAVPHVGVRPVIDCAHLDMRGGAAALLRERGRAWLHADAYSNPGPVQFVGPAADDVTATLGAERHDHWERIAALRAQLDAVRDICRPGVQEGLLDAALTGVSSLAHILKVIRAARE